MKKKLLFTLLIACVASNLLYAAKHTITSTSNLGKSISDLVGGSNFASNDTILLDRGKTYTMGGTTIQRLQQKGMTIMANPATTGSLPKINIEDRGDIFQFNATEINLPDAYFRLIDLHFYTGSSRADGRYLVTTASQAGTPATNNLTYGGIELKGCVMDGTKQRAFFRFRIPVNMESILIEDCIFQNCQNMATTDAPNAYGMIAVEGNNPNSNTIGKMEIRNSIFYNNVNSLISNGRNLSINFTVENSSFISNGSLSPSLISISSLQEGSTVTLKNNIIQDYCSPSGVTWTAPAQAVAVSGGSVNVSYSNNYFIGIATLQSGSNYTLTELSNSTPVFSFPNISSADLTQKYDISGDDALYLLTAGTEGACVGAQLHYVKLIPTLDLMPGSTNEQSFYEGLPMENIVYAFGGTATGANIVWTGTSDASTPPAGITVSPLDASPITISGTPTTPGTYSFEITATDGSTFTTPALTGNIEVKTVTKKLLAYVSAVDDTRDNVFTNALETDFHVIKIDAAKTGVDYSFYDVVVLSAVPSSDAAGSGELKAKSLKVPFVQMKTFQLQSSRWNWITGQANTTAGTISVLDKYHPIFRGIAFSGENGDEVLLTEKASGNLLVKFTGWAGTPSQAPVILATIKDDATAYSYAEIPVGTVMNGMSEPTEQPQIILGVSEACWDNITNNTVLITVNAAKYVAGMLSRELVVEPTGEISVSEYSSGDITFSATAAGDIGQLIDIEGSLTVSGKVMLKKTVESGKWYAIGFPFAIEKVYSKDFDGANSYGIVNGELEAYNGSTGDYWLKSYNGSTNAFEYATSISANTGYIIQFPSVFDGKEITFISEDYPVLKNTTTSSETVNEAYNLIANPSVTNINSISGASHHYQYDADANRFNLVNDITVKPFEAIIVVDNPVGTPLKSISIDGEGTTGINDPDATDKAVDIRYFNLQGEKVSQPAKNNVYIVKTVFESGKVEVSKVIFK